MADHDRRTVTPAQHLALGQLAVGDGSVDHHARITVRTLMSRGLIEAATGADGDLVFDADWRVVYTLTERGRATVAARRLYV